MTAIINQFGKLLYSITGSKETIRLNTPVGCKAVEEGPPHLNMYYENGWVDMPIQTSPNHTFDYISKTWLDQRSIDDVKNQKWNEIKQQRDSLEFGGFSFGEYIFDSDVKSQNRIISTSELDIDVKWVTQDNVEVLLNKEQIKKMRLALAQHISRCHERGQIARQLILRSETIEQIESIEF